MNILKDFYQITLYILPAIGSILLALLIVSVVKLNKILGNANSTVVKVNDTIDEIQKPIATAVKISGGIDAAYSYSENAMKGLGKKIVEMINYLKHLLGSSINKGEIKEEKKNAKNKK